MPPGGKRKLPVIPANIYSKAGGRKRKNTAFTDTGGGADAVRPDYTAQKPCSDAAAQGLRGRASENSGNGNERVKRGAL